MLGHKQRQILLIAKDTGYIDISKIRHLYPQRSYAIATLESLVSRGLLRKITLNNNNIVFKLTNFANKNIANIK